MLERIVRRARTVYILKCRENNSWINVAELPDHISVTEAKEEYDLEGRCERIRLDEYEELPGGKRRWRRVVWTAGGRRRPGFEDYVGGVAFGIQQLMGACEQLRQFLSQYSKAGGQEDEFWRLVEFMLRVRGIDPNRLAAALQPNSPAGGPPEAGYKTAHDGDTSVVERLAEDFGRANPEEAPCASPEKCVQGEPH